jgi:hypothetical protein
MAILAYYHFSIGDHVRAIQAVDESEAAQDVKLGLVSGDVGVLDRIRTRCIRGEVLLSCDDGVLTKEA